MDDEKLARQLAQGASRSLEEVIKAYGRLLWGIASGILCGVGTREDVEEVVSDVFVELWRNPSAFDPARGTLKSFLCVKCRTRALDRLRALLRRPVLSLEEEPEPAEDGLQEEFLSSLTVERINRYLDALPPPDGEILTLRLLYELRPAEIADKLGMPVREIYERIRIGKERLAAKLRQEGYHE